MESNINYSEISKYSREFSSAICDKYFENKQHITGEEILLLTPVQQVNLMIVLELLNLWKSEINKLESPYFNYEADEVQVELKKLMNVLSKNIKIDRENLESLLIRATEKSILLIFSPYQFYKDKFSDPSRSRISLAYLDELNKYIKINKHLLVSYKKKFEDEKIEEVFSEEALKMFDEVCEKIKETPEDFEIYITMFNEIKNMDLSLFYLDENEEEPSQKKEQSVNGESVKNLNETMYEDVETLADTHEKSGIDGIKKNITINQRFMFVNELFKGDADEFESVVNFLDNCKNKNEALDFIQLNYVEGKGWDSESEEYEEFMYIINKRFPS